MARRGQTADKCRSCGWMRISYANHVHHHRRKSARLAWSLNFTRLRWFLHFVSFNGLFSDIYLLLAGRICALARHTRVHVQLMRRRVCRCSFTRTPGANNFLFGSLPSLPTFLSSLLSLSFSFSLSTLLRDTHCPTPPSPSLRSNQSSHAYIESHIRNAYKLLLLQLGPLPFVQQHICFK